MKYKLLGLDMDKTTLRDDCSVSEANKKSIKKFIAYGGKVAIVSGRNLAVIEKCVKALDLEDNWNVGLNGLMLFNYAKKETVLLGTFEEKTYKEIVDIIRRKGAHSLVFTTDMTYYEDSPFVADMSRKGGSGLISEYSNYMDITAPMKILVWVKNEKEEKYWQEVCNNLNLTGVMAAKNCFDISLKGVNKYTGILKLAQKLNINENEIAAIGDYGNDVDMVKNASLGVAVKNATDEVKKSAKLVLDKTNNEDAVSYLIEKYLLQG